MAPAIAQARRIRETADNMSPQEQRDAEKCKSIIDDAKRHGHLDDEAAARLGRIRDPRLRLDACRGIAELNRAADCFNSKAGFALEAKLLLPLELTKFRRTRDPAERLERLKTLLAKLVD